MAIFVEDVLPTDQELLSYRENGWLLTRLFVREEHLAACKAAAEEVYSARYDRVHPWSADKGNAGFGQAYVDRDKPRLDAYVSHHKAAVREVLQSPQLGAYAAVLMDTTVVRLFRDLLFTMPARRGHGTGWHADKNYWPTCSSDKLLTAWFSLSDCDVENGCLVVISGSHRWRRTPFVRKIGLEHTGALGRIHGKQPGEMPIVSIPHRRGQVSFHSSLLLHGAHPNVSGVLRQSFAVVLQDGENRYAQLAGASARLRGFNTNDRVGPKAQDGTPDYTDPVFYPALVDRGAPRSAPSKLPEGEWP
jgi:ectoine hydroxylase-related dioxygenase (phytanoyl-CoA dioxygenase family)